MTDSKFLDSSAWLSYFYAENLSIKALIESHDFLLTSVLSIFEIQLKMLKDNKQPVKIKKSLEFIKKRGLILSLNEEIAGEAVEVSLKHKLSAMDSLIYTSALKNQAIFITLDNDFRGLKNIVVMD